MKPNDGSKMIKWGPKIETGNDPLPQMLDLQNNIKSSQVCGPQPCELCFFCLSLHPYCDVKSYK